MISISDYAGCLTRRGLLSRGVCQFKRRAQKPALRDWRRTTPSLTSPNSPANVATCPIPTYSPKRPHSHLATLTLQNCCRTVLVCIMGHGFSAEYPLLKEKGEHRPLSTRMTPIRNPILNPLLNAVGYKLDPCPTSASYRHDRSWILI